MNLVRAFFSKIRALNFKKGQGSPPALAPSSYAPDFYSNKLPLKFVYSKQHSQSEFNSTRLTFYIFMSIFSFDFMNYFSKIINKIWLLACHKPSPISKLKSMEYCFCSLFSIFINPVIFPCYWNWKGLVFFSIFC